MKYANTSILLGVINHQPGLKLCMQNAEKQSFSINLEMMVCPPPHTHTHTSAYIKAHARTELLYFIAVLIATVYLIYIFFLCIDKMVQEA